MGLSRVFCRFSRSLPPIRPPVAITSRSIYSACNASRGTGLRPHTCATETRISHTIIPNPGSRYMSWIPYKLGFTKNDQFNGPNDNQEEAAKVALLEKAMKGRQPTDLLLRCALKLVRKMSLPDRFVHTGTILDEDGRLYIVPGFMQVLICAVCAFTSSGNVKTISGQFKKSDLCSEHRLNVSTSDLSSALYLTGQRIAP